MAFTHAGHEAIDADDAYNRAKNRGDDITKDREDPQPGPVENRRRAVDRKATK